MDIKPTANKGNKRQPWRVLAPPGFRGSDTRRPYYFETKTGAFEFSKEVNNFKRDRKRPADNILAFEDSDKRWLAYLKQTLSGNLDQLPEILSHWLKTGETAVTQISLFDCVQQFLSHVQTEERPRAAYLADITGKVNRFAAEYPGTKAHEFDRAEIKEYLSDWEHPASRNQQLKRLGKFFDWARKERFVAIDPTTDIDFSKVEGKENIEIYSPAQSAELLKVADSKYKEVAPWFILGLFGFMRPSEIERLDWSAIDFGRGSITIAARVSKTGKRRVVAFNDSLRHWLEPYRQASGPVTGHVNGEVKKVFTAVGLKRFKDGIRHTCVSHAVASGLYSLDDVWRQAGHSPSVSLKHYIEGMLQSEALPYWQIRRPSVP